MDGAAREGRLTIVGGVRERWSVWLRGRRKTNVRPRRVSGVVIRPLNLTVRPPGSPFFETGSAFAYVLSPRSPDLLGVHWLRWISRYRHQRCILCSV